MSRFVRTDINKMFKKFDLADDVVRQEAEVMAKEVGELGSMEMKTNILASGTKFSQAARNAGINQGPGRYRTGNMYRSVEYRVESGPTRVSAAFGWIRNFEDYFIHQELGFKNIFIASYTGSGKLRVANGQPVVRKNPFGGYKKTKGMFALRDATISVQKELPRLIRNLEARLARKIDRA